MKIAMTGANGLIGRALTRQLVERRHQVDPIPRISKSQASEHLGPWWDPSTGEADLSSTVPFDAVIHLGGEPIAARRWNKTVKERIRDSRIIGTRGIVNAINALPTPPRVFISSSAIGFYGDRGSEPIDEDSLEGSGFLAEVCQQWEEEATKVIGGEDAPRVVTLRTGIVLAPDGGFLSKAGLPFRFGVGGRIGDGEQYLSWIHIDDHVAAVIELLESTRLHGPFNLTGPSPVTYSAFTATMGRVLHRPTVFTIPAGAIELVLGKEMARETALVSQRILPKRLREMDFPFRYHTIDDALTAIYGKSGER
jgi:uncharacterized protein (TIGR01777 family)